MRRITYLERQIIEICFASNKSNRRIAKILGRDRRVIDREVNRNTPGNREYRATLAQQFTEKRERGRCKKKLEKNEPLRQFVVENLKNDLSPEQIAGLIKDGPPTHLKGEALVHETIYQYVYNGEGRYECLYAHLRRNRKRRRKRGVRKPRNTTIPERISIHNRPSVIDEKERYGDFECDLLEGPRRDKQALSVHYERKSQYVRLHRVFNKTANETNEALLKTKESFPKDFIQSITFDNGPETARHHELRYQHGIDTYHCDTYASWQKGGVENMNGLIRQYIPKGAKISEYTDIQLRQIETKLNNRPRKSLNYKSPKQTLAHLGVGH